MQISSKTIDDTNDGKKKQGKKKKSCGEQNKTRKISKSNVQTRIYLRNIGSARMKNINDLH